MAKKKCVAMLLAGGKGSRLNSLTKDLAKPAVPLEVNIELLILH
jgi:glucose-1-phosphate adenylyltransferase